MFLTDAHCHLDFPDFDKDREAMLERARQAGVKRFLLPGTTAATWQRTLKLAASHPDIYPCLGLHPYFIDEHCEAHLQQLEQLLQEHPQVVAVGEIGIDLWADPSPQEQERQWFFFDAQLQLAKKYQLPVVLHIRKAMDKMTQRLRQVALPRGGLAHAFSGSQQQAEKLVELGFKLGLGGALTYPRAQKLRRVAANLPISSFVLETDSPDMPLKGYQGQRNEPARIPEVLQVLAKIRQEEEEYLVEQLEKNLQSLFAIHQQVSD
ncbi:TatD DNase family protein [Marinospirillum celere]|uniref:TatD DNase family protein n=1 Tax=Marinospirillum celere TaxID=1122252 RepID=A0A1I1G2F3_9GAMM|nr:TatD family hydrolase [Marinospirillum celere]SFC05506.1 TatD DNase family protein [Marinospirillum celere]